VLEQLLGIKCVTFHLLSSCATWIVNGQGININFICSLIKITLWFRVSRFTEKTNVPAVDDCKSVTDMVMLVW
jgi:hypothetical protein